MSAIVHNERLWGDSLDFLNNNHGDRYDNNICCSFLRFHTNLCMIVSRKNRINSNPEFIFKLNS